MQGLEKSPIHAIVAVVRFDVRDVLDPQLIQLRPNRRRRLVFLITKLGNRVQVLPQLR